jgi:hypothetical protein
LLKGWLETILATVVVFFAFGIAVGSGVSLLSVFYLSVVGGAIIGSVLYGLGYAVFKLISASMPPPQSGKRQRFNAGERAMIYFAVMVVAIILRFFFFGGL